MLVVSATFFLLTQVFWLISFGHMIWYNTQYLSQVESKVVVKGTVLYSTLKNCYSSWTTENIDLNLFGSASLNFKAASFLCVFSNYF